MSFNIKNKLVLTGNLQFVSSPLYSFVKKISKDEFKYLNQEFDSKVLDLVNQKRFYPYDNISCFDKFKEKLPKKERFLYFIDRYKNWW